MHPQYRQMDDQRSSKPLQIAILKAMKASLKDSEVGPEWAFPQDTEHDSLPQALDEHKQIGWHNFFQGRISQTWTTIQQSEYSKQNQQRINNTQTLLCKLVGCQPIKQLFS